MESADLTPLGDPEPESRPNGPLTHETREQIKAKVDQATRKRLEAHPDPEQLEADRRLFAEADAIGDISEEEIERLHEIYRVERPGDPLS